MPYGVDYYYDHGVLAADILVVVVVVVVVEVVIVEVVLPLVLNLDSAIYS